jgi:NAD(P)-dependent dehydrogenase (short-subunit alcohol dehydrogenase family)
MRKPVCAVVGVGEGNGAALARAFARTGMAVALLARRTDFTSDLARELSDARPYACDVSDPSSVAHAFATIRVEIGDPATLVYNAGSGVWGDVESITLDNLLRARPFPNGSAGHWEGFRDTRRTESRTCSIM